MSTIEDILKTKRGYCCDYDDAIIFVIREGVLNGLPVSGALAGFRIYGYAIDKHSNKKTAVEVVPSEIYEQTFKGCAKDFKAFGPDMEYATMYDALTVHMNKSFKPLKPPKDFQPIIWNAYRLDDDD